MIRKSEDLPEKYPHHLGKEMGKALLSGKRRDIPDQFLIGPGFFVSGP